MDFLAAASLKDSRLLLNFGGNSSPPLRFPPTNNGGGFVPLAEVVEDAQVANGNCGWRLNPYDATAGVEVQPDGMAVQAHWGAGWQGCRANRVSSGFFPYKKLLMIIFAKLLSITIIFEFSFR